MSKEIKWLPIALAVSVSLTASADAADKRGSGPAREAVLKKYDVNKNGKLDKEEHAAILKAHDTSKDGKLDRVERKAIAESILAEQKPEKPDGATPPAKLRYPKIKYTMKDWVPVERTTAKIAKVEHDIVKSEKNSWTRTFYRNTAYTCGLSGHYTFVVIEPHHAAGKKAPLWVYLHGGSVGFFDKNGDYISPKFQNKDTYNHEETFKTLGRVNNGSPVFEDGRLVDNDTTLTRRVKEGYRLLVVAYGDHDQYGGMGTPYPNNPKGGEVNGLQATMAAVEYTVANYPTTHVFAHGTSAGSSGAYALGFAFAQDGINLTGVVMDSSINTPRKTLIGMANMKNKSKTTPDVLEMVERENKDGWLGHYQGFIDKAGVMVNPEYPFYPEAAVKAGYRSVPMLIIAGTTDLFFGGTIPVIAEAKAVGMGNVEWMWDGLRQAIKEQKDSPHKVLIIKGGHVTTVKAPGHSVHNDVDAFIKRVSSASKSYPFARAK